MDIFFKNRLEREEKIQFIKDKIIPLVSSSYTVPKEARKRNIILFFCKFKNELGMDDNVQLEFNIGEVRTGLDIISTAKSSILPLRLENVPVYSFETLVAKKIKTFYERQEGKDVYDMYYSMKSKVDTDKVISILKNVLKSAKIDYREFKKELPNKLADSKLMKSLHASTNPYIPKNLRIDFIKASEFVTKAIVPHLK